MNEFRIAENNWKYKTSFRKYLNIWKSNSILSSVLQQFSCNDLQKKLSNATTTQKNEISRCADDKDGNICMWISITYVPGKKNYTKFSWRLLKNMIVFLCHF